MAKAYYLSSTESNTKKRNIVRGEGMEILQKNENKMYVYTHTHIHTRSPDRNTHALSLEFCTPQYFTKLQADILGCRIIINDILANKTAVLHALST
jgi:hypothetical protein